MHAQHFAAHPEWSFIVTELGHGYAKTQTAQVCRLTGLEIRSGETIRRITIITRSGRQWTGYTANRIVRLLGVIWSGDAHASTMHKVTKDLPTQVQAAAADAVLCIIRRNGTTKSWCFDGSKWRSMGAGYGYHTQTTAQLVSAIKRSKSNKLYKLS